MIQVLKHGDTVKTKKCFLCNCEFSFSQTDVICAKKNLSAIYDDLKNNKQLTFVVKCPECNYENIVK